MLDFQIMNVALQQNKTVHQKIKIPNIKSINFEIDDFRKNCLLEGLDDIGFSLKYESEITNYENKIKKLRPWILND